MNATGILKTVRELAVKLDQVAERSVNLSVNYEHERAVYTATSIAYSTIIEAIDNLCKQNGIKLEEVEG